VGQALWRPLLLSAVVVALVVSAAYRADSEDVASAAATSPAGAATETPAATAIGTGSGKTAVPVAAAPPKPPPDAARPPVPEVDEIGTRRLTGRRGATVALTFDDGPHPKHTPEVLEILREYEVTAMFCVVGNQVVAHPDLVREIAAAGHALCNHTATHDVGLPDRDAAAIVDEIQRTQEAILAAVPDAQVSHYRAPGGNFAGNVNAVAQEHGLTPLAWSIDTRDWRRPGAAAIHDQVLGGLHPGAVILLHDGGGDRAGTVASLPGIITSVLDRGYEFVVPAR
jgi:peptidoglycan-N-acetylglucosamine deacetylase